MEASKKRPHEDDSAQPSKRFKTASLPFATTGQGIRTLKSSTGSSLSGQAISLAPLISPNYAISAAISHAITHPSEEPTPLTPKTQSKRPRTTIETTEASSETPLPDYTLKGELSFSSSKPFDRISGASTRCTQIPGASAKTVADRFAQALFYYQFPASPIPKEFSKQDVDVSGSTTHVGIQTSVESTKTTNTPKAWIHDLRNSWVASLKSLLEIILDSSDSYFYILFADFTSVFSNYGSQVVSFNRSTAALRKKLNTAGIKYDLPLNSSEHGSIQGEQLDKIDRKLVRGVSGVGAVDYSSESAIVIKEEANIRSLVDFFVASFAEGALWMGNFPSLLSPSPFINGSVQKLSFTQSSVLQLNGLSTTTSWALTINGGYILPSSFAEILTLFQELLEPESELLCNCKTINGTEWCGVAFSSASFLPEASQEPNNEQTRAGRFTPTSSSAESIDTVILKHNMVQYRCHLPKLTIGMAVQ